MTSCAMNVCQSTARSAGASCPFAHNRGNTLHLNNAPNQFFGACNAVSTVMMAVSCVISALFAPVVVLFVLSVFIFIIVLRIYLIDNPIIRAAFLQRFAA